VEANGLETCDEIGIFSGNSNFHHYDQKVSAVSKGHGPGGVEDGGGANSACMEVCFYI
jgi:hypothetical protein